MKGKKKKKNTTTKMHFISPSMEELLGGGRKGGRAESAAGRLMFKDISIGLLLTFINPMGGRLRADSTFFLPFL